LIGKYPNSISLYDLAFAGEIEILRGAGLEIHDQTAWVVFAKERPGVDERQIAEPLRQAAMSVSVDYEIVFVRIDQLPQRVVRMQRERVIERPHAAHVVFTKAMAEQQRSSDGLKLAQ